ncbi:TPM domain-containing protein [Schnuerera ultunensis]|uniref:TPM domain-containing protein n=1 Tax=Schnuerera ultunensis TaxID=45497 RepID=UPI000418A695|nr:TPM domain-containing protein [Schnuerera ultunensis]
MRKKLTFFIILFILLIISNNMGWAVELKLPEPSHSFYVYDEAKIIDNQLEEYIVDTNKELYKKVGAQIVVASIMNLESRDIKEYATGLFEKWGIGSREYDNGLLILIAPEEREIWIEVGYGLEGALPDSKVGNIIKNFILPYFKEDNYSEGILSGFNEIINEVEKEYNIELGRERINEDLYYFDNSYGGISLFDKFGKVLLVLGIIIFLFIDFKFFNGFITYSLLRGSRFGGSSFGGRGGRSSGGGGRSGGGGAGGKW